MLLGKDDARNAYVDWLRGASILSVLVTHGAISPKLLFFLPDGLRGTVAGNGYYGVCIFFAISGYLIASRSFGRWDVDGRVDVRGFYEFRIARILPLLLLLFAVLFVLRHTGLPPFSAMSLTDWYRGFASALSFQYNALYIAGASAQPQFQPINPLWSLSIEEMFYIVFPLIVAGVRRPILLVVLMIWLVIQGPIGRQSLVDLYQVWGCAGHLAAGVFVAVLARRMKASGMTPAFAGLLMVAGAAIIAFGYLRAPVQTEFVFGPTIVSLGAALFLLGAAFAPLPGDWNPVRIVLFPLALAGQASYEIYVFHMFLVVAVPQAFMGALGIWYSALVLVVLIGGGKALNRYFTEYLNDRLRKHFTSAPVSVHP